MCEGRGSCHLLSHPPAPLKRIQLAGGTIALTSDSPHLLPSSTPPLLPQGAEGGREDTSEC